MRSRQSRTRTRAAVMAALLAVGLLAAGAPAIASPPTDGGVVGDDDPGTGGVGRTPPNTDFKCGNGKGTTKGAIYRLRGNGTWDKMYEAPYTDCEGTGYMTANGKTTLCQSGYLVYRFYGTYSDATKGTAAVTRSRSNTNAWCEGELAHDWTFPTVSPYDSTPTAAASLPWLNPALSGVNADQKANGADAGWSRDEAGHWLPTRPTKTSKATCDAKQSSYTMADYFESVQDTAKSNAPAAVENLNNVKSFIGNMFWNASDKGNPRLASWARAEIGVSKLTGYRYKPSAWTDHSKAPKRDNAGSAYYASSVTFDSRDCASPTMFAADSRTAATARTYTGTCYIPLMRTKVDIVTSKGVKTEKWLPLVYGLTDASYQSKTGYGERLSTAFGTKTYTQAGDKTNPDFALDVNMGTTKVDVLEQGEQKTLLKGWRAMMTADYAKWSKDMYGGSGTRMDQVVPGNAYGKVGVAVKLDKKLAGEQLAEFAKCRVGTQALFNAPEFTDASVSAARVDIDVTNQKVYQVSPTTATITVKAGALKCRNDATGTYGACPAAASVKLSSLTWTTKLDSSKGAPGLKVCKVTDVSKPIAPGCDGVWSMSSSSAGAVKKSDTIKVRFVNPTKVGDSLRLSVANPVAQFTQSKSSEGLIVSGYNPVTGERYTVSSGTLREVTTKKASAHVTGAPVAMKASGKSYVATFPVIGVTAQG